MTRTYPTKYFSVTIDCPFDDANQFLATPENFLLWAAGLGSGIQNAGAPYHYVMQSKEGQIDVRFKPENEFGVADHTVTLADGKKIYVPLRVIRNGDGCDVVLTLFHYSFMHDQQFETDSHLAMQDLARLKTILEKTHAL